LTTSAATALLGVTVKDIVAGVAGNLAYDSLKWVSGAAAARFAGHLQLPQNHDATRAIRTPQLAAALGVLNDVAKAKLPKHDPVKAAAQAGFDGARQCAHGSFEEPPSLLVTVFLGERGWPARYILHIAERPKSDPKFKRLATGGGSRKSRLTLEIYMSRGHEWDAVPRHWHPANVYEHIAAWRPEQSMLIAVDYALIRPEVARELILRARPERSAAI
jgi:hypothetical protein